MFNAEENERYKRHFSLDEIGISGQLKLKQTSVLVIGAGALGCPVLTYLAAAGIGKIGIVDPDVIELSNLHRQTLYTVQDIGKQKAVVASERLKNQNPNCEILEFPVLFAPENAFEIVSQFDIVVDGTDNFPTRYLINDVCVLLRRPNVHGSVIRFSGTVSVFNYQQKNGEFSPNYRDLFPVPPLESEAPSCSEAGVIGIIPSIIGSFQAMEVIKIATGIGHVLAGEMVHYNALTNEQFKLHFEKDATNPLYDADENFIFETNYPLFCHQKPNSMKSITVEQLQELKNNGADFQLIDVREPYENEICSIDGILIPMGDIPASIDKIDTKKQVIIHCRSGKRSGSVIDFLEQNHQFENLYNLEGGILAWIAEIDSEMEAY